MARSRNIKPGLFQNEYLVALPFETRLMFAGLPCFADREGRLEDRPMKLKIQMFPADNVDVDAMLQQLHDAGFIRRYSSGDTQYIQIVNFAKHQNPHVKEAASSIPAPDEHSTSTVQAPDKHSSSHADSLNLVTDSLQERGSQEPPKSAEPKKAPRKRGSRLPENWTPSVDLTTWAANEFPHVDHVYETEKFTDHWRAQSGQKGVKADWNLTWKNWIRKADEYRATRSRTSQNPVREREERNRRALQRSGG